MNFPSDSSATRSVARGGTDEQVLVELRRIIRATQISAKQLARVSGLTTSQLVVMQLLAANDRMTASELAEAMSLSQPTVTTVLDRLEERGFIVRQRDKIDRRRLLVALTDAGKRQLAAAPEALQMRFLRHFNALHTWEQTSILAALQRVSQLLDAASVDAAPLLDIGALDRRVQGESE